MTAESQSRLSADAETVLDAMPSAGMLSWVVDIQAKTRRRMTRRQVEDALSELKTAGLVVKRAPFDIGRPDRWGRS